MEKVGKRNGEEWEKKWRAESRKIEIIEIREEKT